MRLARWLGLHPCSQGHTPVICPPLGVPPTDRCSVCRTERCEAGWCVYRDGDCIKCGWPPLDPS